MFIRLRSVIALCILGTVAALAAGSVANGLASSSSGAGSGPWQNSYGPPIVDGEGVFLASPGSGDSFGVSAAVSADESTIVVGANRDGGRGSQAGAVYVFTRPSGGWGGGTTPTGVKLVGPDTNSFDYFGTSVAVSGDGGTVVVGATFAARSGVRVGEGAAYVFTRPSGGWMATSTAARLRHADPSAFDYFGSSVAVSGDGNTVVAGVPGEDEGTQLMGRQGVGGAYVFTKPATGWANANTNAGVRIVAPQTADNPHGEHFGHSLSMSANGDTIVAGTNPSNQSPEGAYVFTRPSDGIWASSAASAKLTQGDATARDNFGRSVTVSGDGSTVVVRADQADGIVTRTGAAYVFAKPATGWAATSVAAKLTAADGVAGNEFGETVSVNTDGSMIAIGAPGRDSGHTAPPGETAPIDTGAVHLFARPQEGWTTATTSDSLYVQLPTETQQGRRGSEGNTGISVPTNGQATIGIGGNVVVTGALSSGRTGAWVYLTMPTPAPTATPTVTPTPTETPIPTSTPIGGGDGGEGDGEGGEGSEGEDVTPTVTATPRPTATPAPPRPEVGLSTNFLTFSAARGGDSPPAQTFTVWNTERQTEMPFTVSADASWLSLSPRSASSNSPQAQVTVRVSANASGLDAGTYRGRIAISAPAAENTPRMVFVTLNVNGPTTAMTPEPTATATPIPDNEKAADDLSDELDADPARAVRDFETRAKSDPQWGASVLLILARRNVGQAAVVLQEIQDQSLSVELLLDNADVDAETAGQVLIAMFTRDDVVTASFTATAADIDPQVTGQMFVAAARSDSASTGELICLASETNTESVGGALVRAAAGSAGVIQGAIGSAAQSNRACVSRLASVVPVEAWLPENAPQEGADPTGAGQWQDVGSPPPIDNILARFPTSIPGAYTEIVSVLDRLSEFANLPEGSVTYDVLSITPQDFAGDDTPAAHVTMFIDKQWLTSNQVHEWSMQFSRYEESTDTWVPTQTKRAREDETNVYFTVTVPGFSTWAIHGSQSPPVVKFVEGELRAEPAAVEVGEEATVSLEVTNQTDEPGVYFANLWVNGQIDRVAEYPIGAQETITVDLPFAAGVDGAYEIRVGSEVLASPVLVGNAVLPKTGGASVSGGLLLMLFLAGSLLLVAGSAILRARAARDPA